MLDGGKSQKWLYDVILRPLSWKARSFLSKKRNWNKNAFKTFMICLEFTSCSVWAHLEIDLTQKEVQVLDVGLFRRIDISVVWLKKKCFQKRKKLNDYLDNLEELARNSVLQMRKLWICFIVQTFSQSFLQMYFLVSFRKESVLVMMSPIYPTNLPFFNKEARKKSWYYYLVDLMHYENVHEICWTKRTFQLANDMSWVKTATTSNTWNMKRSYESNLKWM